MKLLRRFRQPLYPAQASLTNERWRGCEATMRHHLAPEGFVRCQKHPDHSDWHEYTATELTITWNCTHAG